MAFTHLHVHTEYSLLDGASRIEDLVAETKRLGMDSIAITDHGVMFGVIEFYKECKKQGIKPIIGCEVYVSDGDCRERKKGMSHLLLLAENNEGYHNLVKLVSFGYTDGFYYKPRVDRDLLKKYSSGIIAGSACLAGKVQREILNRNYEAAKEEALLMEDIFGKGNFFLELQDHGLDEDRTVIRGLMELSEDTGIPIIATNDLHYVKKEDSEIQDVLLALQTGKTLDQDNGMSFSTSEFYLKSEDEMKKLFPFAPEALENTHKIAERCNVEFKFGEYHLPEYIPPEGKSCDEYLCELCEDGLKKRYEEITPEIRQRFEYEIETIRSMGYVEYFLIVWDFINYARTHDITVGPGRGSAAGSIVSYSMGITDIDPIENRLIFERFLNPERISMPDIDVDFNIRGRGQVIEYVKEKYGKENVSQIITFGTFKPKGAIRDVGRVLSVPYNEVDKIAKAVPNLNGMTVEKALGQNPELAEMYEQMPDCKRILDIVKGIEGMPRHCSTHAAGVVISKLPLTEYLPLYVADKGITAQFEKDTIEELGLLKMDFLGLRTLTVIDDTLKMIRKRNGKNIDFRTAKYDDAETYKMMSSGNTAGVFQLESGGMSAFMQRLKPEKLEDVVAGIALYRPGPMDSIDTYIEYKKNPESIEYITPELEPILKVTYGCLIYQEQVMQIVRDLAGYSYGRSDLVRRAMSKKEPDAMEKEKQYFLYGIDNEDGTIDVKGCVRNGIPAEKAEVIFADMESFADYAFNKSHAAAYAILAYQTAWLKAHYPLEFMSCLISSVMGESTKVAKYIRSCRDMGIEVLPPSVNRSEKGFSVEDGAIRFGLEAVKNVGHGAIDAIIEAREKRMPETIFDFVGGLEPGKVDRSALKSLIESGATDCLNPNRAAHLAVYEDLLTSARESAKKNVEGQISIFQINSDIATEDVYMKLPDIANFERKELLAMEKNMTGIYITENPLNIYEDIMKKYCNADVTEILESCDDEIINPSFSDGDEVILGGMIASKKEITTKKGDLMAFVDFEDIYGVVELIVFPNAYGECRNLMTDDRCLMVRGKLQLNSDEDAKIIVNEFADLADEEACKKLRNGDRGPEYRGRGSGKRPVPQENKSRTKSMKPVKIRIPQGVDSNKIIFRLERVFSDFRGETQVLIYLPDGKMIATIDGKGVRPTVAFAESVAEIVGNANVKIEEMVF